jgi:hypothetical protein
VPADFREHVERLLREDRRSEVVEYFFTQVVGVPAEFVGPMQAEPSWQTMCRYAHTLPYDAQIAAGTQDGKPLPTDRWSISRPVEVEVEVEVEVVVGKNSPAFFTRVRRRSSTCSRQRRCGCCPARTTGGPRRAGRHGRRRHHGGPPLTLAAAAAPARVG